VFYLKNIQGHFSTAYTIDDSRQYVCPHILEVACSNIIDTSYRCVYEV